MKKMMTRILLPLCLVLGTALLPAQAAELPQSLMAVKNISHPEAHRYAAGQPAPETFSALAQAGVRHVIDLRLPEETPDFNEAAAVTKAGMAYYNIPIAGANDLTHANVNLLDKLLHQIGDEPVLVHCGSSNRVGAIMALRAAWLAHASPNNAIAIGKRWGLTKLQPRVEALLKQ